MKKPIGRIIATEKVPTTMDKFTFWTDSDLKLHAFDIVKVKHIDDSYSFGVIENISHITDAQSFLTSFISSDFWDVTVDEPTLRVGMNYVEASVSYNNKNLYTPVHNNEPVYLASENEITMALGLDKIQNPLVCGSLKMYEGTSEEITLPVNLNSKFILGPEGAHLNISGISGLASKTSYAMFLMKAVQEQYLKMPVDSEESVAFVIFNVKGKDLMAIHSPNDFKDDSDGEKERVYQEYKDLGLSTEPFKKVKYFIPYSSNSSAKQSTYLPKEDIEEYIREGQLQKFKYSYEDDKESLEMLFADIDDPQQTMEAIISKIIDATDPDFGGGKVNTWEGFREKVDELSQKSQTQGRGTQRNSNEISVLSWRKFKRIVNKAIKNDDMFANRADSSRHECRLADAIKHISNNDVYVIDVAKLTEDKQAFVFGDAVRTIYKEFPQFDVVGVTTLFTFYWKQTVDTIKYAQNFCKSEGKMLVGGIASTILPDYIYKETGIKPHIGLLDKEGDLDEGNTDIIDELPLDYSILEEIDYEYPAHNAYFGYMTRGCPRNCAFCAVKTLEPQYKNYIGIKHQIKYVDEHFGAQKDLLLMDNNVFASNCFEQIIDEIKDCGFGKGATYIPPNEYDVAIKNLKVGYNLRAYTKKIIKLYDEIAEKLSEDEAGEFYLRREERGLLYAETATYDEICTFDETIRPLYDKLFHKSKRVRYIDFNQGLDARLATDKRMKKLSEINIRPLRIAFDHYEQSEVYISAVKKAAKYGIMELSNYLLYNFEDEPKELYYRMRINVDLCEELGVTIYSFPMKYHPINDPEYFKNRDYLGKHWNRKFIRAVQAVLNSTKGKIGKGIEFFEEAFGRDLDEFYKILWMPETFIIYRRKYDKKLRERLADRYKLVYMQIGFILRTTAFSQEIGHSMI